MGGSVAEWLACGLRRRRVHVQIAVVTLSVTVLGRLLTPIVGSLLFLRRTSSSKIGSSCLKGCGGNCKPGGK